VGERMQMLGTRGGGGGGGRPVPQDSEYSRPAPTGDISDTPAPQQPEDDIPF